MTSNKKRRVVSLDEPRYPHGQVGRRRFLRDLGLGAAALSALPLTACATDNDASGTPRMPDWQVADGGVAPSLDAAIDRSSPLDLEQSSEQTVVDCLLPGVDAGGDGAVDTNADASARTDGGIPDGAGTDGAGDGGAP